MSFLDRVRRISRALPIDPRLLHRLRRGAAVGFRLTAWVKLGRKRRRETPRPGPVCVVGFHGSVLGIGEAARGLTQALRLAGADVREWDISVLFGHDVRLDCTAPAEPPADAVALVLFLNPNELVQLVAMAGAAPFQDRFCVGLWFWELEQIPRSWRAAMRYVDEAWGGSGFCAQAIAGRAPKGLPVRALPCPAPVVRPAPDRAAFDLPADTLVVLTAFDVRSGFTRKNPLAAVRAFRKANAGGKAVMVCKAAGVEGAPDLVEALRREIGEAGDVRLMTDWLTGAQMKALIASADIVLSMHRSEGFGLLPAQAMAAGKAVVATGWSANLDFMTPDNSMLVDYVLVPVQDPQGLYDGGRWADPDVDDAARKLAALFDDPALRARLGAQAADDIARLLDPAAIGAQARAWLEG
ncbi:MAG TPA: glycosyltransferase family 4 protein [Caulobacteraceae bacterium]|nr:glycosyltransferase family 4 protein [Caulobacteraceae bacterium]